LDDMQLLIFNRRNQNLAKRLLASLVGPFSNITFEYFDSFSAFIDRLHRPYRNIAVIVFIPNGVRAVEAMIAVRDLLDDMKVICLLKSDDERSKEIVHHLYPRYISYSDNDFSDILEVLSKMRMASRGQFTPRKTAGSKAIAG